MCEQDGEKITTDDLFEKVLGSKEVKKIATADWLAKGTELFGDDPKLWRFVCPNCKHVQSIADFIALREAVGYEGEVQNAYYSCIGRYDTRIPEKDIGTLTANPKSPCDYTLGGLICLAKTIVVDDEGKENPVFEFATIERITITRRRRR